MRTPIQTVILMALLAITLVAIGWWQLAGVPLVENEESEHVEHHDE